MGNLPVDIKNMLAGSLLEKLATAHQGSKKRPLNFGVYYKNTLVALCHALEDCVLEFPSQPLMITAFQRGKWYLEEADRYGSLAEKSRQVVIMAAPEGGFAEHPTSQRANVDLVSLKEDDPVSIEWHLMILAPTYTAMVLCQELSAADYRRDGVPTEDRQRKFYGFWTFEPELVTETVELAIDHIHTYNPQLADKLHQQVAQIQQATPTTKDDQGIAVTKAVTKVVQYLQVYQDDLPHSDQHLDHNLLSNEVAAFLRMAQLIDQADPNNPHAAAEVAALAEALGQLIDLPAWQMKRLRLAGLLHRLAPLQAGETTVDVVVETMVEEPNAPQAAALEDPELPKASLLRIMPRLQAIAQIITHQQEHWDGTGLPSALAFDRIPLESRILGLTAHFQQQVIFHQATHSDLSHKVNPLISALADCQAQANKSFDPKLVETLGLLVKGLEQGLTIAAHQPKIAAGMWLLDKEW
jgi:DICT domain-containing protein